MKWLTFIRKDFFQLFQKNLALIWKYVTKTDIAKSRLRKTEILPSYCSECLASSLGRWTVSYECVMATGLMLACHHVTLHTGLWIPDLSYCPHGPHVTRIHNHPLTISGVDRPTYKYHLRNDKKVLSWLVLLSPRLWCWYVAPPYGPANPRQTCRAQSPGRNSSSFSSGIVGQDWTCESLAETD